MFRHIVADIFFLYYTRSLLIHDKRAVENRPQADHDIETEIRRQPEAVALSPVEHREDGPAVGFHFAPEAYASIDESEEPLTI